MPTQTLVIAELGSCWRFGDEKANARRMIKAAHECGANIAKMQWVSDYRELMKRRGALESEEWAYRYVHFPAEWIPQFKAYADEVGIEWACTAYLPQDVAVIAPFVKRFKVAAKEANDVELMNAVEAVRGDRQCIVSNAGYDWINTHVKLYCVSKYPTQIDELKLKEASDVSDWGFYTWNEVDCGHAVGLSDHTAHVLTGAVAVGAGARIVESHVRLHDTPRECPDYPHSLQMDFATKDTPGCHYVSPYEAYVQNIRTAERML